MLSMTRSLLAGQREASERVAQAQRFSLKLPLIGSVRVPPPDQLAFLGALGALVAFELIDWPVAVAMGIGCRFGRRIASAIRSSGKKYSARKPGIVVTITAGRPCLDKMCLE